MQSKDDNSMYNRRDFLFTLFPACALFCLGEKELLSNPLHPQDKNTPAEKHKFQNDSGMTYEQVFKFTFRNWYIRYLKGMEKEIGKARLLELLKSVGSNVYTESVKPRFQKIQEKTVDSFIRHFWVPTKESRLWGNAITIEIVKQTRNRGIVKMKECLVAKTFREENAGDIGYAAICHADFAVAQAFNPNMKFIRNQCLMRGDACCYFEYSLSS
jgi:hypothetical protein